MDASEFEAFLLHTRELFDPWVELFLGNVGGIGYGLAFLLAVLFLLKRPESLALAMSRSMAMGTGLSAVAFSLCIIYPEKIASISPPQMLPFFGAVCSGWFAYQSMRSSPDLPEEIERELRQLREFRDQVEADGGRGHA